MSLMSMCLIALLASCSSGGSSSTPVAALTSGAALSTPLSTSSIAVAATGPSLAQAPVVCTGTASCSLAKAPANGDVLSVVVLDGAPDLGGITVADSHGKALTRSSISPNCASLGHCVAVYDELVAGTPGNTVTVSNYEYRIAVYDIAGASYPGSYASNSSGGLPSALAATIAGVKANDLQICGYLQATNSNGNVALTYSNGSGAYDVAATEPSIAHASATTTAAATCTASNLNADYSSGLAYADYTAAAPVATPVPGPSLAQAPVVCSGTASCSLAKAPANGDVLSVVVLDGAPDLGGIAVADSHGKALTRSSISPNCASLGHCVAVYDELVAGTPGNTVTVSNYEYRIAVYDIAGASYPGSYAANSSGRLPSALAATIAGVKANDLQICGYLQATNSNGNVALTYSNGSGAYDVAATEPSISHASATTTASATCTASNLNTDYSSGLAYADYSATQTGPTPTPAPTATPTAAPTSTPTPTPAGVLVYNATSACIANVLYTNNVLPAGVGEFATNGLNRAYWGGVKTRTVGSSAGTWGPGFFPSWGRHQYDTYFGDRSDGLGLDPFTVTNDTAVAGSPQALRIMAEPMPSNIANSLTVMANDQYVVTAAAEPYLVPTEGGSLTVNVANPNGAQNKWKIGMGYAGGAVTFIGTLTSGGATPSGNGSGGSNPWTISNIHIYSGTPGTAITPGVNDEGGLRSYNFPQYYSGALDTNINQQYGFFVSRVRLPNFLPALSPAFWTLETGGVANGPSGLQRNEDDIEEMFANTEGNGLNAGQIMWNTSPSVFWPKPTGVYGFPSGTPQSAYHDYGVLLTPGSTSFYLDGQLIAGHSGGPDWTQGSPDKEVMLMFQVGSPGSWLDASSQGPNNPWPQYYWTQWIRVYQPTKTSC